LVEWLVGGLLVGFADWMGGWLFAGCWDGWKKVGWLVQLLDGWFNDWMVGSMIVGFLSFPCRIGGGYCLFGLNCLFV
jgi:hypothetical protein